MSPKEFGFRVRERRKELDLSQMQLAEQAGISRIYLSEIERGKPARVSKRILAKLATALKAQAADLTSESTPSGIVRPSSTAAFYPDVPKSEPDVLEWLEKMPEKWKRLVRPRHEAESISLYRDADIIATGKEGAVYFVYCLAPSGKLTTAELEVENALDKAGLLIVRPAPRLPQSSPPAKDVNEMRS